MPQGDHRPKFYIGEELGRELSARMVMFHQAIAQRVGLNVTDHKCGDLLLRMGPMTAGELARETGLTTGAITGVINRLEKAGFACRETDPRDRRRVIVRALQDEQRGLQMRLLFESFGRSMGQIMAQYSESERRAIYDFVTRTAAVMKTETQRLRQESARKPTLNKRHR